MTETAKGQFKRWLTAPPRPHGAVLKDRTVSNLELFYDLAYVAVIAQASQHLAKHVSLEVLRRVRGRVLDALVRVVQRLAVCRAARARGWPNAASGVPPDGAARAARGIYRRGRRRDRTGVRPGLRGVPGAHG